MKPEHVKMLLTQAPFILGEGAVIERLRRDSGFELDTAILHSVFCYHPEKRRALADIFTQYMEIGNHFKLPLMLSTPTWRASRDRVSESDYSDYDVNGDNFRFLDQLREQHGEYGRRIMISGLLGCRGDAYDPSEALGTDDARVYHSWQAKKLASAGVDFLLAATLPALSEAVGIAQAMADTGKPYVISFVVRPEGTLLDGTALHTAIVRINSETDPMPAGYMINCTHPSNVRSALVDPVNSSALVRDSIMGLQANTAALAPEELDNRKGLVTEDPDRFARSMADVGRCFGMKLLGGCCGTDDRHIRAIARCMVAQSV